MIRPGAGAPSPAIGRDALPAITRYAESKEFRWTCWTTRTATRRASRARHCAWRGRTPTARQSRAAVTPAGAHLYDSAARRHTSFTAIEVITEIDDEINVEVREEDIKMDVFRSAGGRPEVNKTSSAAVDAPSTGIVVCANERSQHRNRDGDADVGEVVRHRAAQAAEGSRRSATTRWMRGSQIRSYAHLPVVGTTDQPRDRQHWQGAGRRSDEFVEAYLQWQLQKKSKTPRSARAAVTPWINNRRTPRTE